MKAVLVLASVVLAAAASSLRGAKMLMVVPQTEDQLRYLYQLLSEDIYDFWREPGAVGSVVNIMVTHQQLPQLTAFLTSHGLEAGVGISDVGKLVEEQMSGIFMRGVKFMDWTDYHDYDTINDWLVSLAADHPNLCSVEEVGKSYEGRVMNLLTLGKGGADKPGIFIDGGIHAREWISPATVTYMVNELVTNSGAYDDLLSSVNFYVMPVINPDGYAYTFSSPDNRMWRKTRSDKGSQCKGVDPNRNWGFHWNEIGASNRSCSEMYAGSEAFSEVEMRVVRDQITRLGSNIKVYLTFHSFGQKWMYPWGFTKDLPEDWKDLDNLARAAVSALTAVHGTSYSVGSSTNVLYAAAGGSDDWSKGVGGIKYAYTVELRDNGVHCFALPKNEIIPSGEETFEALKVIANFVKNTYSN